MKTIQWVALMLTVVAVCSCREHRTLYDSGQKPRIMIVDNDTTTTLVYSFAFEPVDQESFLYEIPVNIMGMPPQEDAVFEVELLRDSISEWVSGKSEHKVINGEEGVDFELGNLVIEKGKATGIIPIRIYRKDYMTDNYVSVLLTIRENDNFMPMQSEYFRLLISNEVTCPQWWSTGDPSSSNFLSEWCSLLGWFSSDKYLMMLSFYWKTEKTSPVFYSEVFDKYGRYLSDTYIGADGQTHQTNQMFFDSEKPAIWASLVLIPLCEYYKQYYESLPPGSPTEFITTMMGLDGDYWLDPVVKL